MKAKRALGWLLNFCVTFFSDKFVLKRYEEAGIVLGATLSDMNPVMGGQCDELQSLFDRKNFWEKECKRRGYKTMTQDAFMWRGGWGKPLEGFGEKA
ncbi:MAG: hypothetical protein WC643_03810 [Parcubacteria group bacterium]